MTIAVNTRFLIENQMDGIGWFTHECLQRITAAHPEHDFIFLFDRPFNPKYAQGSNVRGEVLHLPTRHPLLYLLWFEWKLPSFFKKNKVDLFVSPDGLLSLRANVPQLSILHDINFHHNPKEIPFAARKYYNFFVPQFAKKAQRIATVSEYSKQDIATTYGISKEKIDVVYNGVNETYVPLSESKIAKIRTTFSSGKPYFIFVGTLLPRKNIANMLRAYDLFRAASDCDFPFLIIGNKKWWNTDMESTFSSMKFGADVHFLGRQEPQELRSLLAAAHAMIFTTLFEGFGIPILEGMAAGVPVITSNITSMPEVGGKAVLLANPHEPSEIAEQMRRLAEDETLRKSLIDKGFERVKQFSWQKTANLLWQSIERTLIEISPKTP